MTGDNRTPTVEGTQEISVSGIATASPFGPSPGAASRRHKPTRLSKCNLFFSAATRPGSPLVTSDTRGTIKAITRAKTNATPQTIITAASGRGTRTASSPCAAGDSMTPTTKAATIGNTTSRAR